MTSVVSRSAILLASMLSLGALATLATGCSGADASSEDGTANDEAVPTGYKVNGHTLSARETTWMTHVANVVVPNLPGDRDTRIARAAEAAWWSLKEGDFDVSNPPKYSNCTTANGDVPLGPLEVCGATAAWQVGLAGVQVTGHTVSEIESWAATLTDETPEELLADAATEAGYASDSDTYQAIVASTGQLRVSWLLRNSLIGFAVVSTDEVTPECITGDKSWCYGKGWDTTAYYAPTKTAAMKSISDIKNVLDELAP